MVYTVTLNPSLDYSVYIPDFQMGKTNRTAAEQLKAGGKGINASLALKGLGIKSKALGFLAGFTGEQILHQLRQKEICSDFIMLNSGTSRINIKIQNAEGTEINGAGPQIDKASLQLLEAQLSKLNPGDWLIVSGSIPSSLPIAVYGKFVEAAKRKGVYTIVDASKESLLCSLSSRPFLIKPNKQELEELFDVAFSTREQAIPYAKKLQTMGAQNVMVSMGSQGAIMVTACGKTLSAVAPQGKVINAVGAGDAMVAGFLAGWLENKDFAYAFRMAVASGSACAFSESFAQKEDVLGLIEDIQIYK